MPRSVIIPALYRLRETCLPYVYSNQISKCHPSLEERMPQLNTADKYDGEKVSTGEQRAFICP